MLLDCLFAYGLLDAFCVCKILVLQILLTSVLIYLYGVPVLLEIISLY